MKSQKSFSLFYQISKKNHNLNNQVKLDFPKSTKPQLAISRAKYTDMPTIAGFIRSSADWYREFVDPRDMAEHEVGQKWIDQNYFRRDFYIGREGDTPVGTISHQVLGDSAYLGYIYLDTNHVGKGFGHQLMDYAKDISIAKNLTNMVLIAHPKAKWATRAYEKYGFECIATNKQDVLAWNNGALKSYYEEGFHLYRYSLK